MIHPPDLRKSIRITLEKINLHSRSAVELLMLTAAKESLLGTFLFQRGGPALGIYQMEPATFEDNIWWIHANGFRKDCGDFLGVYGFGCELDPSNIDICTAIARMHYRRIPTPLPDSDDVWGLAEYWHKHWCRGCRGTVAQAFDLYHRYALTNAND